MFVALACGTYSSVISEVVATETAEAHSQATIKVTVGKVSKIARESRKRERKRGRERERTLGLCRKLRTVELSWCLNNTDISKSVGREKEGEGKQRGRRGRETAKQDTTYRCR